MLRISCPWCGERDEPLERRRPRGRCRPADLASPSHDRHGDAGRRGRSDRNETRALVQALDVVPVDLEADDHPRRRARGRRGKRGATDECRLLEIDQPAEAHLVWRVLLEIRHRLAGAVEIHVHQQQTGLDARDVEREHAGRLDGEWRTGVHQRIPDLDIDGRVMSSRQGCWKSAIVILDRHPIDEGWIEICGVALDGGFANVEPDPCAPP